MPWCKCTLVVSERVYVYNPQNVAGAVVIWNAHSKVGVWSIFHRFLHRVNSRTIWQSTGLDHCSVPVSCCSRLLCLLLLPHVFFLPDVPTCPTATLAPSQSSWTTASPSASTRSHLERPRSPCQQAPVKQGGRAQAASTPTGATATVSVGVSKRHCARSLHGRSHYGKL